MRSAIGTAIVRMCSGTSWVRAPPSVWNSPAPTSPRTSASARTSSSAASRLGIGLPPSPEWNTERDVDRPAGAAEEALAHDLTHRRDLVGASGPLVGLRPHHVVADRGVADEGDDVHAQALVEDVEVLAERLPPPIDALGERGERHLLDEVEEPGQRVAVLGPAGRERDAAVAGDDRRHAVADRRRRQRIPVQLRVVVRVGVDEPRRDDAIVGVDDPPGRSAREATDLDDPTPLDADVGAEAREARAVDHGPAPHDEVQHVHLRCAAPAARSPHAATGRGRRAASRTGARRS